MKEYKGNDKYAKMMGGKSGKLMKNHGNTSSINTNAQKADMGRVQNLKMNSKGYSEKAFDYKY
jgi:hypothetical protein